MHRRVMRPNVMRRMVAVVTALMLAGAANAAGEPEAVEFPGGSLTLRAMLYRPDGGGPFPAVIALHGCDGLAGRTSRISRRYREWGEHLRAAGFAVLFPDSFRSRNIGPQC